MKTSPEYTRAGVYAKCIAKSKCLQGVKIHTVKPRPEAHMGMIPPEALLKGIGLTPQQQTLLNGTIYIIYYVIAPSDPVESSGYSSGAPQGGSCPCAPLDEALRYIKAWSREVFNEAFSANKMTI